MFPTHLDPKESSALSLQFIIQELILMFQHLESLQKKIPHQLKDADLLAEIDPIARDLEKFLLFSLENPLSQRGGSLDKLCFYSEILLQASSVIEETNIPMLLEAMRSSVLRIKQKLLSCKESPEQHSAQEIGHLLLKLFEEFHEHLRKIFSELFSFLKESRTNENLLYLLIEQKDLLNQYVGSRTVETILARLFPQGPCELRATLCNGYARRGFLDFYSRNESLIDALEWEEPSCPLSPQKR